MCDKETQQQFNKIHITCATRGEQIKQMEEKLDKIDKKLDVVLENKADKSEVNRLENFITKVMWTAITSLIGFLITVIWFLISQIIK